MAPATTTHRRRRRGSRPRPAPEEPAREPDPAPVQPATPMRPPLSLSSAASPSNSALQLHLDDAPLLLPSPTAPQSSPSLRQRRMRAQHEALLMAEGPIEAEADTHAGTDAHEATQTDADAHADAHADRRFDPLATPQHAHSSLRLLDPFAPTPRHAPPSGRTPSAFRFPASGAAAASAVGQAPLPPLAAATPVAAAASLAAAATTPGGAVAHAVAPPSSAGDGLLSAVPVGASPAAQLLSHYSLAFASPYAAASVGLGLASPYSQSFSMPGLIPHPTNEAPSPALTARTIRTNQGRRGATRADSRGATATSAAAAAASSTADPCAAPAAAPNDGPTSPRLAPVRTRTIGSLLLPDEGDEGPHQPASGRAPNQPPSSGSGLAAASAAPRRSPQAQAVPLPRLSIQTEHDDESHDIQPIEYTANAEQNAHVHQQQQRQRQQESSGLFDGANDAQRAPAYLLPTPLYPPLFTPLSSPTRGGGGGGGGLGSVSAFQFFSAPTPRLAHHGQPLVAMTPAGQPPSQLFDSMPPAYASTHLLIPPSPARFLESMGSILPSPARRAGLSAHSAAMGAGAHMSVTDVHQMASNSTMYAPSSRTHASSGAVLSSSPVPLQQLHSPAVHVPLSAGFSATPYSAFSFSPLPSAHAAGGRRTLRQRHVPVSLSIPPTPASLSSNHRALSVLASPANQSAHLAAGASVHGLSEDGEPLVAPPPTSAATVEAAAVASAALFLSDSAITISRTRRRLQTHSLQQQHYSQRDQADKETDADADADLGAGADADVQLTQEIALSQSDSSALPSPTDEAQRSHASAAPSAPILAVHGAANADAGAVMPAGGRGSDSLPTPAPAPAIVVSCEGAEAALDYTSVAFGVPAAVINTPLLSSNPFAHTKPRASLSTQTSDPVSRKARGAASTTAPALSLAPPAAPLMPVDLHPAPAVGVLEAAAQVPLPALPVSSEPATRMARARLASRVVASVSGGGATSASTAVAASSPCAVTAAGAATAAATATPLLAGTPTPAALPIPAISSSLLRPSPSSLLTQAVPVVHTAVAMSAKQTATPALAQSHNQPFIPQARIVLSTATPTVQATVVPAAAAAAASLSLPANSAQTVTVAPTAAVAAAATPATVGVTTTMHVLATSAPTASLPVQAVEITPTVALAVPVSLPAAPVLAGVAPPAAVRMAALADTHVPRDAHTLSTQIGSHPMAAAMDGSATATAASSSASGSDPLASATSIPAASVDMSSRAASGIVDSCADGAPDSCVVTAPMHASSRPPHTRHSSCPAAVPSRGLKRPRSPSGSEPAASEQAGHAPTARELLPSPAAAATSPSPVDTPASTPWPDALLSRVKIPHVECQRIVVDGVQFLARRFPLGGAEHGSPSGADRMDDTVPPSTLAATPEAAAAPNSADSVSPHHPGHSEHSGAAALARPFVVPPSLSSPHASHVESDLLSPCRSALLSFYASAYPAELPLLLHRCGQHALFIHLYGWQLYERRFSRAPPVPQMHAALHSHREREDANKRPCNDTRRTERGVTGGPLAAAAAAAAASAAAALVPFAYPSPFGLLGWGMSPLPLLPSFAGAYAGAAPHWWRAVAGVAMPHPGSLASLDASGRSDASASAMTCSSALAQAAPSGPPVHAEPRPRPSPPSSSTTIHAAPARAYGSVVPICVL